MSPHHISFVAKSGKRKNRGSRRWSRTASVYRVAWSNQRSSACDPPTSARSAVYLRTAVFSFGEWSAKSLSRR